MPGLPITEHSGPNVAYFWGVWAGAGKPESWISSFLEGWCVCSSILSCFLLGDVRWAAHVSLCLCAGGEGATGLSSGSCGNVGGELWDLYRGVYGNITHRRVCSAYIEELDGFSHTEHTHVTTDRTDRTWPWPALAASPGSPSSPSLPCLHLVTSETFSFASSYLKVGNWELGMAGGYGLWWEGRCTSGPFFPPLSPTPPQTWKTQVGQAPGETLRPGGDRTLFSMTLERRWAVA